MSALVQPQGDSGSGLLAGAVAVQICVERHRGVLRTGSHSEYRRPSSDRASVGVCVHRRIESVLASAPVKRAAQNILCVAACLGKSSHESAEWASSAENS